MEGFVGRDKAWIFGLVGMAVAYFGFPTHGLLSGLGLIPFLAQGIFLIGMVVIAMAFSTETIEFRDALGWSAILYLVCAAFAESDLESLRWLIMVPLVALAAWTGRTRSKEGWFSGFPDWLQDGLALLLGAMGSGMIFSGMNGFLIQYQNFDFTQVGLGAAFYIAAYAVLLVRMREVIAIRILILGYSAALAAMFLYQLVEIAKAQTLRVEPFLILGVITMLSMQVMRHFYRKDGWLKLIETAFGGVILAAALADIVAWQTDKSPWAFLNAPGVMLAYFAAGLGLVLIWSYRIVLLRIFRSMNGPADAG